MVVVHQRPRKIIDWRHLDKNVLNKLNVLLIAYLLTIRQRRKIFMKIFWDLFIQCSLCYIIAQFSQSWSSAFISFFPVIPKFHYISVCQYSQLFTAFLNNIRGHFWIYQCHKRNMAVYIFSKSLVLMSCFMPTLFIDVGFTCLPSFLKHKRDFLACLGATFWTQINLLVVGACNKFTRCNWTL